MRNAVEHEARYGDRPQDLGTRCKLCLWQAGVIRQEGVGHEALEASGLVGHVTKAKHVDHTLLEALDRSEQHRAVADVAEFVHRGVDVQVFLTAFFAVADDRSDLIVEDFCAAAGELVQTRIEQALERVLDREVRLLRQVLDLNGRERLDRDVRVGRFGGGKHRFVRAHVPIGVQAANGVDLRHVIRISPEVFHVGFCAERIRVVLPFRTTKRAEPARKRAHVGGVDVDVVVEEGPVSKSGLFGQVSQAAELCKVRMSVEEKTVFEVESSSRRQTLDNRGEAIAPRGLSERVLKAPGPVRVRAGGTMLRTDGRHANFSGPEPFKVVFTPRRPSSRPIE